MRGIGVTLAAALLSTAGCIGGIDADGTGPKDAAVTPVVRDALGGFEDALLVGHDHADLALHSLVTPTMEVLGADHLESQSLLDFSGPILADLVGDDLIVVSDFVSGFVMVDISDRTAPKAVGRAANPAEGNMDVAGTVSGDFVFLTVGTAGSPPSAGATGLQAWYVGDPSMPTLAGYWPMYTGCHTIDVFEDIMSCAGGPIVHLFRILESPPFATVVPLGTYSPYGVATPPVLSMPGAIHQRLTGDDAFAHEATIQADPVTGDPVMFVSFWDQGVHVVDLTDPSAPKQIGVWNGEGRDETYDGNIHTTMAGLVEGRRVVVTLPEFSHTPAVTFLDATDYAGMKPIGVWIPKADYGEDDPFWFSTHNFQFVNGRVYVTMYHGGMWVIDASSLESIASPTTLGYALPASPGPERRLLPLLDRISPGAPMTMDVLVKDGYAFLVDYYSGVVSTRYKDDTPGDPAITGFA